jgi:hypothetical protein
MDRFLSSLKQWLKFSRIEQDDLAKRWGENIKNLSAYVTGRVRMPDHLRTKFTELGYEGPWPKEEKEALGTEPEVLTISEDGPVYTVTATLPEHVQEAYDILMAAVEASGADIKKLDRRRTGLVVGLIAAEVAKGAQGGTRQTLIRRAEVLLALKG